MNTEMGQGLEEGDGELALNGGGQSFSLER